MKAFEIINISKVSEVLTENPTYLRIGGQNERVPNHYKQQVQELLSYVDSWLLKWDKRKIEVDLFNHFEELPSRVKNIIAEYAEATETWELRNFVKELEKVGYTCEVEDCVPFNLRKV